jgi:hypothetical protein
MNITICARTNIDHAKIQRDKDIADLAERARIELWGLIDQKKITDLLINYMNAARSIK